MIHLNLHSCYGPLDGLNSLSDLCLAVKKQKESRDRKYICLTDTNGLYGSVHFVNTAKEYGLIPIIGSEVVFNKEKQQEHRIVMLAKNRDGHQSICRILSCLHRKKLSLTYLKQELQAARNHLICFSDDKKILTLLMSVLPKNHLYGELTPGFFSHSFVQWLRKRRIPLVASSRARHLSPQDSFFYKLLQAIKQNTTFGNVDLSHYKDSCYFFSHEQALKYFHLYPEAIENTYLIAEQCRSSKEYFSEKPIFPKYEDFSEKESALLLREKCIAQIPSRWPELSCTSPIKKVILQRLDYELDIIVKKGFASYFLVVEDIIKQSAINCGRGSAAASLVSYLLGITHVDPIEHNLFFDRFLNPEREDPPDIDIDFPWDERDYVLEYVFKKFPGRAAMVANHNFLREKSALREVAKVYGIAEDEISYISKRFFRHQDLTHLSELWKKIFSYAEKIEHCLRHLSVHCGGVVITPGPIEDYVPIEIARKGVPVIQWEKEQAELAGLVKIDLLGNRSLAVIRDCLEEVNQRKACHEAPLVYENFNPIKDPGTIQCFEKGETIGVFYVESPGTRLFFQKMKSGDFKNIIIAGSIIRPAALKQANAFVSRLHGQPFRYLHPLLEEILHESYGLMIYQEDVTRVAMALADFTSFEGNDLRKVLGKKHKEKKLDDYKERFFRIAKTKGASKNSLKQIWQMVMSFSGYSFCKAHSASYALVAFKSCFLKKHYPAEFMAAVVSNRGGFYDPISYLDEARRMGVEILGVDINFSELKFTGRDMRIRTGFMQVKALSLGTIKRVLNERKQRPFIHIQEFLQRVEPSFSDARVLVMTRAFESIRGELSHSSLMWEVYFHYAKKKGEISQKNSLATLGNNFKEYKKLQLIHWEISHLQGAITFPSWWPYRHYLQDPDLVQGADLKNFIGKEVKLFGEIVTSKRVKTRNQQQMQFVSFSDQSSLYETVFFPEAYYAFRDLLFLGGAFIMKGVVMEDYGSLQVNIQHLSKAV